MDLKLGDLVTLKSGGPVMTVCELKEDKIMCEWFNREDKINIYPFKEYVLKKRAVYDNT